MSTMPAGLASRSRIISLLTQPGSTRQSKWYFAQHYNVTGISATNNIIYDVANPIVNSGTGNTTSPNAINQTGYVNPNVSIGSYNASLGGSASLAAFMAAADNQSMTNWNPAYTAAAADSYIQAGFATPVTQVTASPASGVELPGNTIILTMDFGQAVTVTGTPTLSLNDGGAATYSGGSGTNALTFSYTVGASDSSVSALAITAVNLPNGAAIDDEGGNPSNFSNALVTFSGLQIDPPTGPTLTSIVESPASGDLNAGKTVTLTLNLSEAVTVAGGTPTLTLNDGGTATYTGGSGSNALTFSYTVAAGQNTAALAATAVNLNSATVTDGAGNAANLSLTGLTQSGPQIDTTTPAITSLVESPSSGDLNAGKTVTLTMNLSEAVTVAGGTPTLTLNDGGTATYTRRLRHQCADLQLHRRRRTEHREPRRHRRQSQRGDGDGRRRQCRQPVAHRPDPERPADRHHDADDNLAGRVARKRRSQCRQDRHPDPEPERGGDRRRRHPDADAQ